MRLVSDDLAEGTLVHVIPDIEVPDRPLYALHSPGTQTTARVRLFLDFVSEWFRKQAPNQQGQQAKLAAVKSA
jgi:DNA-binding transcriptional LysR family regulator